jgi:hypothetical protein
VGSSAGYPFGLPPYGLPAVFWERVVLKFPRVGSKEKMVAAGGSVVL